MILYFELLTLLDTSDNLSINVQRRITGAGFGPRWCRGTYEELRMLLQPVPPKRFDHDAASERESSSPNKYDSPLPLCRRLFA
jgi:hypothetical protein